MQPVVKKPFRFMWLEITGKCQLECSHCYADSGPQGDHGTMTISDWQKVMVEGKSLGVGMVQFIGGEPTMHPHLSEMIDYALGIDLEVEVYTNLVSVSDEQWERFRKPGVRLATSFYTGSREEHEQIVRRDTLRQTQRNIEKAVTLGLELRIGRIDVIDGQDIEGGREWLESLGIPVDPYVDHVRGVGRGTSDSPNLDALCGNCASGVLAIGPTGMVWPCVFSRWMPTGNVKATSLTDVVNSRQMAHTIDRLSRAFAERRRSVASAPHGVCRPYDQTVCNPDLCNPERCRPGVSHNVEDKCIPDRCGPETVCSPWTENQQMVDPCYPNCAPGCTPMAQCMPRNPQGACKPNNGCEPSATECSPACNPSYYEADCGPAVVAEAESITAECRPVKPGCNPHCMPRCSPVGAHDNCQPNLECDPIYKCHPRRSTEDVQVVHACGPDNVCDPAKGCSPWQNCGPVHVAEHACIPTNCAPQNNCQPSKSETEELVSVHAGRDCNPMCNPFAGCSPWNPCNPEGR